MDNVTTICERNIVISICINTIIQLILEIIFEIIYNFETRINHLSLTLLNAFISYKTLSAICKDKFRFLHEDLQIFILLEILLITGDLYLIIEKRIEDYKLLHKLVYTRLFFLICSTYNLTYSIYIMIKYELYHLSYQGPFADN